MLVNTSTASRETANGDAEGHDDCERLKKGCFADPLCVTVKCRRRGFNINRGKVIAESLLAHTPLHIHRHPARDCS